MNRRTAAGGRIDRARPLRFRFDDVDYTGYAGDTLASALLANGVHQVATSVRFGRPRGITAAGVEDSSALVQIEAPYAEPMRSATAVELVNGLVAHGLRGKGQLGAEADPARYDTVYAHCELLVVGAGPAGLAAALTAARAGARVVLVDDQPEPGGSLLSSTELLDRRPASSWVQSIVSGLEAHPEVRILQRTTAFGRYDDGYVLAIERRTDHLRALEAGVQSRHRIWRIRAQQIILATGAHERSVVFADNDRPGIMLADSANTYLNRYGVLVGQRAVVFTTNDSAYATAVELADAGIRIAAVVDSRAKVSSRWAARLTHRGISLHTAHVVTGTSGASRVESVDIAALDPDGATAAAPHETIACDTLLVAGGWNPVVHLYSHAGGVLRFSDAIGAFVGEGSIPGVHLAGAAAGTFWPGGCMLNGTLTARDALAESGISSVPIYLPMIERVPDELPPDVRWWVPEERAPDQPCRQFVDLARDSTTDDILRATGAGLRSVEHVKRYTTIGTAHDQGKTSGIIAAGIVAEVLGVPIDSLGTTTFRPPYVPVPFAALAGRDTGELHDPIRVTAIHPLHVAQSAVFENVGQWKRPWYYPRDGEDIEAAVARECAAARTGVAMMDGSTLGKIDVSGPDAGAFLDLLYTNLMSTLKVGHARYGLMCGVDGMVIDDGTVIRIDEQHYLLTTTTGNAAKILEWMEEWLQTEWPRLRVALTSVTEHWVTIPLVGPRSRDVLAELAPGLPVSKEAFPFMTWRDATVAGIAARVCRISFSGELAYEVNVAAWYGPALWQALLAAGEKYAITTYGTETMHVLRAEKGYPIIGQDTDGTVTPHDLGMSWVVSKKKADFIGLRSFDRADNKRPDRRQLVGLLPVDPGYLLAEGAQVLESDQLGPPPVPMLGHVTSSYRSVALGRTFALALVKSGRDRMGETLYAWHDGDLAAVTVAPSVLYDPDNERRDG
jgi:sarcosine oxidase subunit alpha